MKPSRKSTRKTIHDAVLGELAWDKKYRIWTGKTLVENIPVEIRLLNAYYPEEEGNILIAAARDLVPWVCRQTDAARIHAADKLLELHSEIFGPMSREVFLDRLRPNMICVWVAQVTATGKQYSGGCKINFSDKLGEWEHIIEAVFLEDKTFHRVDPQPMLEKPERKIRLDPFPPLVLSNGVWKGKVVLKSWLGFGFVTCLGAYGSKKKSDGTVDLSISAPVDHGKELPSMEQVEAFRYLMDHENEIRDAMLGAITSSCQKQELDDMSMIAAPVELKDRIGLDIVHIISSQKEGRSYVGFQFGCDWDEEHGLGVMTHGTNIVAVGSADMSFEEPEAIV